MLVDEAQTIKLACRQARQALSHDVIMQWPFNTVGGVRHPRRLLQS
jgi:hypothetical protein